MDSAANGERAFTMIEVLVVIALLAILLSASFVSLAAFNRNVERLSDHMAGYAVVEGELERIRTITYNPPIWPFAASNVTFTTNVALSLDRAGSNYLQTGTLTTLIVPFSDGHRVRATITYTNSYKATNIWMETVVNKFVGGQP